MEIGVDYYPEHWERKDWEPHASLMEEAGFKVVRLAEFAWSKMEPREGKYEFSWLDDAMNVLRRHNIRVILGTPTAAPPPWLVTRYPETLAVNQDGVRTEAGGRRHYCFTSQTYREFTRRIVTAMAQHYADHPAVVGWQTDNEIGGPRCWCENCIRAFRDWLKNRYGTLEKLNQAWGTSFWSQEYSDWNEIPLPREKHASHSPSIRLDHARFHSHQVVTYHETHTSVLRQMCPRHFITHNCMGFYDEVDYFELVKSLDLVAWDYYPGNNWGDGKAASAGADYMRSVRHNPFMVMEQRSGLTGWLEMFQSGDMPGQLRLWTYQTVAHGADRVLYFRWRTCRFGIEQYWHGILDHHGQPGRRYRELKRVGQEFSALADRITGAQYVAPVGILIHPDSRWALEIQKGNPHFDYMKHMMTYYQALSRHHAGVEFLQPSDDFSPYRILVAPTLFLADSALAAKLTQYVENGGALVLTFRSGVKDAANVVTSDRLPGVLKHLAGCEVEEYDALVKGESWKLALSPPLPKKPCSASVWCDQLKPVGAKVLAKYAEGPFKGSAAAVINRYGSGKAVYIGFQGNDAFCNLLVRWLLSEQKLLSPFAPSEAVEITERIKGKERFLFILNHSGKPQKVALPARLRCREVLTGRKAGRQVNLPPHDIRILSPVQAA